MFIHAFKKEDRIYSHHTYPKHNRVAYLLNKLFPLYTAVRLNIVMLNIYAFE